MVISLRLLRVGLGNCRSDSRLRHLLDLDAPIEFWFLKILQSVFLASESYHNVHAIYRQNSIDFA